MAFKPILFSVILVLVLGTFLTLFVAPFVDTNDPNENSSIYFVADFFDNGISISWDVPIFGEISTQFDPIGIFFSESNSIRIFIVDKINLMTYIPDVVIIPLMILVLMSLIYGVVAIIRGIS